MSDDIGYNSRHHFGRQIKDDDHTWLVEWRDAKGATRRRSFKAVGAAKRFYVKLSTETGVQDVTLKQGEKR